MRLGTNGRVLARSTVRSQLAPAAFDGSIRIVGPAVHGEAELIGLDPFTLAHRVSVDGHTDAGSTDDAVLTADAAQDEVARGTGNDVTVLSHLVPGMGVEGLQTYPSAGRSAASL